VEALEVTVSVAVRLPNADGVKIAMMLQLAPALSLFGLIGQFVLDA
jgi:hypothetical protein